MRRAIQPRDSAHVPRNFRPRDNGAHPRQISRVRIHDRRHVSASGGRLGHLLNNKLIGNDLILVNNRPNVNGSALILRITLGVGNHHVLCTDNRRDTDRLGLHTRQLKSVRDRYCVIDRAHLRRVFTRIGAIRPRLLVISSMRAICARATSRDTNSVARIHRYSNTLLGFTGRDGVPIVVVNRVAGRNDVTNPGLLRRVISAILRFRNSHRGVCHVLQTHGGHFKDASRLTVCRVLNDKLHRIAGPDRLLLGRRSRSLDNITVSTVVRNIQPFLVRIRTLIKATTCNIPRHLSAKFSHNHVGVLLTILRGHTNFGLPRGSIFLGVTNKLHIDSPKVSLTIVTSMLSDGLSLPVSSDIYVANRINLDNRVHPIGHVRRHVSRTTGLNFEGVLVPRFGHRRLINGPRVRIINITAIRRTFHVLFK